MNEFRKLTEDLPKIVAIHGAPRSGTSWLGQLFNSSEYVAYRYQPLFSYAFKGRLSVNSTGNEIERFFQDLLSSQDDFVLQRGTASLSGYTLTFPKKPTTHLVYKEVRYHEILENLLERLPSAVGIGLVRHPCAVIHSWMSAPREFKASWAPIEEWRHAQKKNGNEYGSWYGFERWKELSELFLRLQKKFPDRFVVVRYEHLISAPEAEIGKLFEICGLPVTNQVTKFLSLSMQRNDGHPYGVFRDQKNRFDAWVNSLDRSIANEIYSELLDTPLAVYLERD